MSSDDDHSNHFFLINPLQGVQQYLSMQQQQQELLKRIIALPRGQARSHNEIAVLANTKKTLVDEVSPPGPKEPPPPSSVVVEGKGRGIRNGLAISNNHQKEEETSTVATRRRRSIFGNVSSNYAGSSSSSAGTFDDNKSMARLINNDDGQQSKNNNTTASGQQSRPPPYHDIMDFTTTQRREGTDNDKFSSNTSLTEGVVEGRNNNKNNEILNLRKNHHNLSPLLSSSGSVESLLDSSTGSKNNLISFYNDNNTTNIKTSPSNRYSMLRRGGSLQTEHLTSSAEEESSPLVKIVSHNALSNSTTSTSSSSNVSTSQHHTMEEDRREREQRRRLAAQIPPSFPFYEPISSSASCCSMNRAHLESILRQPSFGIHHVDSHSPVAGAGVEGNSPGTGIDADNSSNNCAKVDASSVSSRHQDAGGIVHSGVQNDSKANRSVKRQNSLTKFKSRPRSPPPGGATTGSTTDGNINSTRGKQRNPFLKGHKQQQSQQQTKQDDKVQRRQQQQEHDAQQQPHVSLFKRPEQIKLPGHLGHAIPDPRRGPKWMDEDLFGPQRHTHGQSSSSSRNKTVKFDPRILVMEYLEESPSSVDRSNSLDLNNSDGNNAKEGDNHHSSRRQGRNPPSSSSSSSSSSSTTNSKWFTSEEINSFKMEVFRQAQMMMLTAPKVRVTPQNSPRQFSGSTTTNMMKSRSVSDTALSDRVAGSATSTMRKQLGTEECDLHHSSHPPSAIGSPTRTAVGSGTTSTPLHRSFTMTSSSPRQSPSSNKALFSNPMLKCTLEESILWENTPRLRNFICQHVQRILVVDPNEKLHALFQRAIQPIFPDTNIICVSSVTQALERIEMAKQKANDAKRAENEGSNGFDRNSSLSSSRSSSSANNGCDILIIEERLSKNQVWRRRDSMEDDADIPYAPNNEKLVKRDGAESDSQLRQQQIAGDDQGTSSTDSIRSGSDLIRYLTQSDQKWLKARQQEEMGLPLSFSSSSSFDDDEQIPEDFIPSLYIGISAYLAQDGPNLLQAGADIMWGKPPPRMDTTLRNELLIALLKKRGKSILILP